jgi:hypothetical protein
MQARPTRGSRISSFYPVKSLPSLSSLESAFQLQEYISLLIRLDVHDVERIASLPSPDSGNVVDESCWIYEQLRRLAQDLSHPLITMLQVDCTRQSCSEMKAGEWLYLCVAHGNEGAMEVRHFSCNVTLGSFISSVAVLLTIFYTHSILRLHCSTLHALSLVAFKYHPPPEDTLAPLLVGWDAYLPMPTSITENCSSKRKQRVVSMLVFSGWWKSSI